MPVTVLRFEIELLEPFAVASPEEPGASDLPVARDPHGRVWVPPTSLAGSLRSHLRSAGLAESLMGSEPSEEDPETGRLAASVLWILGTVTTHAGAPIEGHQLLHRTETAIDRERASAALHSLHSRELAPAGTIVVLYARADRELTDHETHVLAAWRPWVGGGRTSGRGRARLRDIRAGVIETARPEGLLQLASLDGPQGYDSLAQHPIQLPDPAADSVLIDAEVEIVDGLHVGGDRRDNHQEVLRRDDAPVVEGTSLKGVLRSRAEFVMRSMGVDVCITASCGSCPACQLFGSAGHRGRIRVRSALVEDSVTDDRMHVAIDRFTGGAASGRLFSETVVVDGRLRLVVEDLGGADGLPWAVPLLLHVLRDIHEGFVGIGGRTSRGLGTVRLADDNLIRDLPPLDLEMMGVGA